jgi:hypothetical protein
MSGTVVVDLCNPKTKWSYNIYNMVLTHVFWYSECLILHVDDMYGFLIPEINIHISPPVTFQTSLKYVRATVGFIELLIL